MNKYKNNKEVVISLNNIGKQYIVHHEKPTLVEKIGIKLFKNKTDTHWALKNVDLKIFKGEKIGFYGPNGVGKTTLLKIITGITTPTLGKIYVKGKVVSLIDLESGFHPDLSGHDNIILNGMIIGMTKDEIYKNIKRIVKFADIGDYIYSPLYTYSNGMRLRLGFSIALYSNPDILILDEIMAVGDDEFKNKVKIKLDLFLKQKKTILVVSQWLEYLKETCTRLIYFNRSHRLSSKSIKIQ